MVNNFIYCSDCSVVAIGLLWPMVMIPDGNADESYSETPGEWFMKEVATAVLASSFKLQSAYSKLPLISTKPAVFTHRRLYNTNRTLFGVHSMRSVCKQARLV